MSEFKQAIVNQVRQALQEDLNVSAGELVQDHLCRDLSAILVAPETQTTAVVMTREPMVVCGVDWVNEVFTQVDPSLQVQWQVRDAERVDADSQLFCVSGSARSVLTAERSALNFLQTLSGTATVTAQFVDRLANTQTRLLDTRKTIPGLRVAQKYAVTCGGGLNHRIGLYDAFLIKENHINACGSITAAVAQAQRLRQQRGIDAVIEVEVETLEQLQEAIDAHAEIVMLDNFSIERIQQAVVLAGQRCKLEVSGNITADALAELAATGVDFISSGALTKHLQAIDLSMLFHAASE